jgi:uncharacterized protein YyaL (SSP411 family)
VFNFHYGVQPNGNAPAGADPHGEFVGKNILIERHSIDETARHFDRPVPEIEQLLSEARCTLFGVRAKRPRPHLDDKIITAWNGLMISGFARAAQVLGDAEYVATAERARRSSAAIFMMNRPRRWCGITAKGRSAVEGFADDYAFTIQGLLDLYEASFDVAWLKFAIDLQGTQDRLFFDTEKRRLLQRHRNRSEHSSSHEGGQRRRGTSREFYRCSEPAAARADLCRQRNARTRREDDRRL